MYMCLVYCKSITLIICGHKGDIGVPREFYGLSLFVLLKSVLG